MTQKLNLEASYVDIQEQKKIFPIFKLKGSLRRTMVVQAENTGFYASQLGKERPVQYVPKT